MMRIFKIILILLLTSSAIFIVCLAISPNPPDWTGFGGGVKDPKVDPAKTLWDWLELLIIPVAIGVIGWVFKESEKVKDKRIEDERYQNETLTSLFSTITELLIEHRLSENPSSQIKTIAKTRINVALSQLEGPRKGQLLQFLYESNLIDVKPKIILLGANFNFAIIDEIVLGNSEIRGAYFKKASIQNANLNEIILNSCDLTSANLSGSLVCNADFSYTNLSNSCLNNMDLTSVNFEGADLSNANLKGSKITQSQLDLIIKKKGIKLSKNKIS